MNEHEKWESRRAYYELLSIPPRVWRNRPTRPNRCKCGCDGVWNERIGPRNLWSYMNVEGIRSTNFLFPLFRPIHAWLWALPDLVWSRFAVQRASLNLELVKKEAEGQGSFMVTAIATTLLWVVVGIPTMARFAGLWTLSRLGGGILIALHLICLGLLAFLILVVVVVTAVMISIWSLAFIVGGTASILYSYYPWVGVALVAVGVVVEYESRRRSMKLQEEQIGKLVLLLQKSSNEK